MKVVVFSTHLKERTNMYFIKTQCKLRFFEIRKHSISGPFEGRLVFKWFGFGMVGLLALDQSGIRMTGCQLVLAHLKSGLFRYTYHSNVAPFAISPIWIATVY